MLLKRYKVWLIVVAVVCVFSLIIHIWRTPPRPANMAWYQCVAEYIYGYLTDWGVILSATGTLLLAVIAFWTIRQSRRSKIANELYAWARNSLRLILTSGETGTEQQIFDKLQSNLSMIHSEALVLIVDAAKFSDSVLERVKSIISKCQDGTQLNATMENFEESWQKLRKIAESIDEDLYWVIFETS